MKKREIKKSITIGANPKIVFRMFVDPNQLTSWLNAHSAVVAFCKNGPYAIGWHASDDGNYYVSSGFIKNFKTNKMLQISKLNYFFPNKTIFGPLELTFNFKGNKSETVLTLSQTGSGSDKNWEKNFEEIADSWEEALFLLKKYIEKEKTK